MPQCELVSTPGPGRSSLSGPATEQSVNKLRKSMQKSVEQNSQLNAHFLAFTHTLFKFFCVTFSQLCTQHKNLRFYTRILIF